jgi:hypothetical protein
MSPKISAAENCASRPAVVDPQHQIMKTPDRWLVEIKMALSEDLLSPTRREEIRHERLSREARRVRGHCYVATEAAYHLFGKDLGYVPERVRCADGDTRWWLRNKQTNHIIDPTVEETDGKFDYRCGKPGGFLTREPSGRCRLLMQRVLDAAGQAKPNPLRDFVIGESAPEICVAIS